MSSGAIELVVWPELGVCGEPVKDFGFGIVGSVTGAVDEEAGVAATGEKSFADAVVNTSALLEAGY